MRERFLIQKLEERSAVDALRSFRLGTDQADYYSNDYLGIAKQGLIEAVLAEGRYAH